MMIAGTDEYSWADFATECGEDTLEKIKEKLEEFKKKHGEECSEVFFNNARVMLKEAIKVHGEEKYDNDLIKMIVQEASQKHMVDVFDSTLAEDYHLELTFTVGKLRELINTLRHIPQGGLTHGMAKAVAERDRQIGEEGWTPEHDSDYADNILARAGACYAQAANYIREVREGRAVPASWPWDKSWWKPTPDDRDRELEKAAALIIAELDRRHSGREDG